MSGDGVRVNEDGSFKNVGDGPGEDTNVHTRSDGDHEPERPGYIDHEPERPSGSHQVLRDLPRKTAEQVEAARDKTRGVPWWAPYAGAAAVFVLLMGLGVFTVWKVTSRSEPEPEPVKKAEEVGGVPVRDDLNAPGL